jgi:CRISPR-associated exonuclease Cas4
VPYESTIDEAPSDFQGSSIDIVTVHKAKGLEWPIVIPINFVTLPENEEDFFFRSNDNSVHWTLGDVVSSTLDAAVAADRAEAADERERLLYVACTRALDLLVLPAPSWAPEGGWAKFFDLGHSALDEIKYPSPRPPEPVTPPVVNRQSGSAFARASNSG